MKKVTSLLASSAIAVTLVACGEQQPGETEAMEFARPDLSTEVTTGMVMELPVTTTSDEARDHFLQGQRALDMGRFVDANQHFEMAVEADSTFAQAYLNKANSSPSLDGFKTDLDRAKQHAEHASDGERLLIEITQKGFDSDVEGQLSAANELVQLHSTSPRAWLTLAGIQAALNNHAEARTSMNQAAELAPNFATTYMQLGNSYLFNEPRDFAQAEESMLKAVESEPNEPNPHDNLGDAYRAQGELEKARDEYARAAELDPTNALPVQQRGHVNSFLGAFDEARADYDLAISLGRANEPAAYGVYRAFVSVHAGQPDAAIEELNGLVNRIDAMGIDDPTGLKIFALTQAAMIGMHSGNLDAAEQALEQRTSLMRTQIATVGTDEFSRSQEANVAYFDGLLAARRGDYETANTKITEFGELVEPDANPRKMEPAHQMMGLVSLLQGNGAEAVSHFEQGNLTTLYTKYLLARSHEEAGHADVAKRLYGEIANYNFNSVGFALVRQEATEKSG